MARMAGFGFETLKSVKVVFVKFECNIYCCSKLNSVGDTKSSNKIHAMKWLHFHK